MKPEYIDRVIDTVKFLGALTISAIAFVKGLREIVAERSMGRSALNKLKEQHDSIKKEFEDLKRQHSELNEDISEIKIRYEKFFEKILSNFPFKQ